MRRLFLLLLACFLAYYGVVVLTETDPPAAYAVRDGLILWAIAALLFMLQAPGLPSLRMQPVLQQWPLTGRFLAALGVGLALAAAAWALFGTTGPGLSVPVALLWGASLLALGAGVLWPGGPAGYSPPSYRWELDAAGRYVRRVFQGDPAPDAVSSWTRGSRWGLVVLAMATGVAALYLRLGQLLELPAGCIGIECSRALQLIEGDWQPTGLFTGMTALLYRLTGEALLSLRLAGALFGMALLPLLYGLARAYTRAGGAAVAVILLAFSPWHLWVGRLSHEWVAVPVFVAWTLWAMMRAVRTQAVAWWCGVGLGLGVLLVEVPELGFTALVWMLFLLGVGGVATRLAGLGWGQTAQRLLLVPAAMLVVALPALAGREAPAGYFALNQANHTLWEVLTTLIRPGLAAPETGPGAALLPPLAVVLVVLGVAYLVRHLVRWPGLLLLGTLALLTAGLLNVDWIALGPAGTLLPLLPLLLVTGGVAADRLLFAFQVTWRPLFPAPKALAGALVVVLVLALWQLPGLFAALEQVDSGVASSAEIAMGQYLAQCLTVPEETYCAHAPDEPPPLLYVPAGVLNNPTTRLLIGSALESERVRSLDVTRDLLPTGSPAQGRIYFVALDNQLLLDLLQQLYPEADATAPATEAGPTLFVVYHVSPRLLAERQGLQGAYAEGDAFLQASEADLVFRDGPLRFNWATEPPLSTPFTVAWEGSLLAPVAGSYDFMLEIVEPAGVAEAVTADALPPITLQLDERLVLDSTLGLLTKRETLAQGAYRLRLYARAADPLPDFRIRWRPPESEWEDIPRHLLFSPPLPQVGLIGTYYAGSQWQGPALSQRKDLVLDPAVDLPAPYSVRWQGKVAAPRAGEYLFAVSGDGLTQLLVDGRFLLDHAPGRDPLEGPDFTQVGIYLARGWRDIEIRYAPDGPRPTLRILWQPPGSGPELLRSRFLLPVIGEVYSTDVALPALPELWDARLGDDSFALSYMLDFVDYTVALPPAELPALFMEQVWHFARCGSGQDQLDTPHGVALDMDARRVYVADTGNRRVAVFDLDSGAPVELITDERFEEPTDVAIYQAPGQNSEPAQLFVLDAVAHPIFRLDPIGGEVAPMPLQSSFYRPRGMDVDENGVFWIADTGGARVAAIGPDGELVTQMGGHGTLLGRGQPVDVLAQGGVRWAVTAEDGRVWQLDVQGSIPAVPRVNTVNGPHLAGLPDGSFFLSDPAGRSFTYHASSGEPLRRFAYSDAFMTPTGIAAAQEDDLVTLAVVDSAVCGLSLWQMQKD